ncbi:MAG: hypothetical protein WDZ94_00495 [Patescibacteria group bacterium]
MKNDYNSYLQTIKEFGEVEQVKHPLIYLSGLPNARPMETIVFETGEVGHILSLNEDTIEATTFSRQSVKIGTKAARTNTFFQVPVGNNVLGKIVDPTGQLRSSTQSWSADEYRDVEGGRALLQERSKITKPLFTGVSIIDLMLPLGSGQRQMIVGDRQTGKTSILLSILTTQARLGSIIVYASIGKEQSEISRISQYCQNAGVLKQTVIVASSASDSPSLVDMTPYTAMTIAEYFKDQGKDVVLILDDLTTHARYYRELALLGKRFPGRDSYPGDIFYKHARLLERAGNFVQGKKNVAITCLPVSETIEESLTDYITSNLIGITDGHFLFSQEAFNRGRRPAIDLFYSVTRVGRQTQQTAIRELNHQLMRLLSDYEKALKFAHFGAELIEETKQLLHTGSLTHAFFEQRTGVDVPQAVQTIAVGLILLKAFDDLNPDDIASIRQSLTEAYQQDKAFQKQATELLTAATSDEFLTQLDANKESILKICKPKN